MAAAGKPFRPEERPGCVGRPRSALHRQQMHFEREQRHDASTVGPAPNVGAVVPASAPLHLHLRRGHAGLRDSTRSGAGPPTVSLTPREGQGLSWGAAGARPAGGARGLASHASLRGRRPPAARSGRERWPPAEPRDGRGSVPEMRASHSEWTAGPAADDDSAVRERAPSGHRRRKPSAGKLPCVERGPAGHGRPVRRARVTTPGAAAVAVAEGATGSAVAGSGGDTGCATAAGCYAGTGSAGPAGTGSDDGGSVEGTGSVAADSVRTGSASAGSGGTDSVGAGSVGAGLDGSVVGGSAAADVATGARRGTTAGGRGSGSCGPLPPGSS